MISLSNLLATRDIEDNSISITFTIDNTTENLSNYQFNVLRANSCNDNFKIIHSNVLNLKFIDRSVNLVNHEIKYFYKIQIKNLINSETKTTDYFTPFSVFEDEYSFAISNIYNTYLSSVIYNNEFLLSKRMKSGDTCECYDDVRNSSYEGECSKCFGTNFKGGFYKSIEIKVCLNNSPSFQEEMNPTGTVEKQSPIQGWTSNYPVIQEGDILTDLRTNIKYAIMSWQPSHKNGSLIRQTFQMIKIPESSIFNKISL